MPTQNYRTPNVTDTQGIYEYSSYINDVAGGILFPSIIFVIWVIVFIATLRFGGARSWTYASFLCMVLAIMLTVLDLTSATFMYLFIFFTGVGFVWLKLETRNV